MDWLADPAIWASLLTLTAMEIVLGIDNLIFLAILADRLPPERRQSARRIGLVLALGMRLGLLAAISWLMRLTTPLFEILGNSFSWRDLILIGGGLFLVYKGTAEVHERIEGEDEHAAGPQRQAGFLSTIVQIVLLDIVFSLDSVITAVGMANQLWVMMVAVTLAVILMLVSAGPLAAFINRHPTVKMLALSFLLLIGTMLVADGFGVHVPRGYIYAAIGFSALVEMLNQFAARGRTRTPRVPGTLARPPGAVDQR
jgi:predicted tellurium resistance membrane protein TerC